MNWIFIFLAWPMHKYDLILDLPELEFSSFPSFLFVCFSVSPPVQDRSLQSWFSLLWFPAAISSAFPQSGLNRLFGHVGMSFPRPWWFFGILLADLPAFLAGHQETNADSHNLSWPLCLVPRARGFIPAGLREVPHCLLKAAWKVPRFSLIHSLMTVNLFSEVLCSLSILLLWLISIFSKIRHCLRILLQQIPPGLDCNTAAWLEFAGCCSWMEMDLGAGFLLGPT